MTIGFFDTLADLWQSFSSHATRPGETSLGESAEAFPRMPCPLVNVDGTPMVDNTLDVLGKVYGDPGPSIGSDL